jgi:thioester reductase-like protein
MLTVLTGSTGFVGVFVLVELLLRLPADSTVVCLVRVSLPTHSVYPEEPARAAATAKARVEAALFSFGLLAMAESLNWRRCVDAQPANLSLPLLCLAPETFAALGAHVGLVLHCGAIVNGARPYSRCQATNVGGTASLLQLASLSCTTKGSKDCKQRLCGEQVGGGNHGAPCVRPRAQRLRSTPRQRLWRHRRRWPWRRRRRKR